MVRLAEKYYMDELNIILILKVQLSYNKHTKRELTDVFTSASEK